LELEKPLANALEYEVQTWLLMVAAFPFIFTALTKVPDVGVGVGVGRGVAVGRGVEVGRGVGVGVMVGRGVGVGVTVGRGVGVGVGLGPPEVV